MGKLSPFASAEQLRKDAKKVCSRTVRITQGQPAPCEGYIVNAEALEKLADLLARLKAFSPKNWPHHAGKQPRG